MQHNNRNYKHKWLSESVFLNLKIVGHIEAFDTMDESSEEQLSKWTKVEVSTLKVDAN